MKSTFSFGLYNIINKQIGFKWIKICNLYVQVKFGVLPFVKFDSLLEDCSETNSSDCQFKLLYKFSTEISKS